MNALNRFSLEGKVIVLTGGTGLYDRGMTADLAAAGATLIIASRNAEVCHHVAEEERQCGGNVTAAYLTGVNLPVDGGYTAH